VQFLVGTFFPERDIHGWGQPLTTDHGAPLRLVITVKHGVKNFKQIGTIR
jgi:hypothetical protein